MQRILFVCLGNICRSPAAEGIVRTMAARAGVPLILDSAGTSDWEHGRPPHPPMQHAARARGYDLTGLRARQATPADFDAFDEILAMDRDNLRALERLRPARGPAPRLFLSGVPGLGAEEVPDPYYSGDFDGALDLIEAGASALIARLSR